MDPSEERLQREFADLHQRLGKTVVFVTHDIEGGLLMCDRVAMLNAGTLRFCGTPDEFRNSRDPVVRAFVDRAGAEAALDNQLNVI